jgi:hypothetical protein
LANRPRPLAQADTFATRDKTVAETLRSGNPTLREFTDEELFNEIQERAKCLYVLLARVTQDFAYAQSFHSNTLIDALPTRDTDRRALRALIETEDTVTLRQFMEADLGLGGRSRILRPVLYESRPTEVTKEALYISTEMSPSEVRSALTCSTFQLIASLSDLYNQERWQVFASYRQRSCQVPSRRIGWPHPSS